MSEGVGNHRGFKAVLPEEPAEDDAANRVQTGDKRDCLHGEGGRRPGPLQSRLLSKRLSKKAGFLSIPQLSRGGRNEHHYALSEQEFFSNTAVQEPKWDS